MILNYRMTKFLVSTAVFVSAIFLSAIVARGQTTAKINKIKADFVLNDLPDNGRTLHLKRNKTYQYTHFSGFKGIAIIDEGTYKIDGDKITFTSTNGDKSFDGKTCYIKYYSLKGKWQVNTKGRLYKYQRHSLFKQKIVLFSFDPIDQGNIEIVNYNKYPPKI